MNNIKHKWYSENELIEKYLCSEECAFEIYRKFIDSFEEKEIVISHVFNMDIQIIDMKSEQDVYLHLSGHLTNAYFKKYGKDKLLEPGAVIIPESQPLYIRIKEDAIKRGFTLDNSLFF